MLPGFGMGIVVSDPVKKIVATPATTNTIATRITIVRFIIINHFLLINSYGKVFNVTLNPLIVVLS
jgi:hypothetical protein